MFTFSALINVILFTGISILITSYIINNIEVLYTFRLQVVNLFLILILLRLIIPVELPIQTSVYIHKIWPQIYTLFIRPIIVLGKEWNLLSLMILISTPGIIIKLIHLICSYHSLKRIILGFIECNDLAIIRIVQSICQERNKSNKFHIARSKLILTPLVFGLLQPTIVIPENDYTEDEWRYILTHEIIHFYRGDLWFKFLFEVLLSMYWWFPPMYILRGLIFSIQELLTDTAVTKGLTPIKKMEYLNCLIKVAKSEPSYFNKRKLVISFQNGKENDVIIRIKTLYHLLLGIKISKMQTLKNSGIGFILLLCTLFLPNLFIFEPYSPLPQEYAVSTFAIRPDNAYLVRNPDDSYQVYIDNQYIKTIQYIPNFVIEEEIKIYTLKESLMSRKMLYQ